MARDQADGGRRSPERPPLGEETRAVVRARIIDGATVALAERGFSATVDDIAAAAGVSRRTVFRHFPTHDAVTEAAVAEMLERYENLMPELPALDEDLEVWLLETATAFHDLNAHVVGKAFWDLNVERPGVRSELWSQRRSDLTAQAADHAWSLAGSEGKPPAWVVHAFAVHLSGFATHCLSGYNVQEAGRISAQVLSAVLAAATTERK